MKNLLKKLNAKKNNKGFTLVELIIVIAIIAILTAVLAPQYIKYVNKAEDAVIESAANDVKAVVAAEVALGNLTIKAGETSGTVLVKGGAIPALTNLDFSGTAGYIWDDIVGGTVEDSGSTAQYTITVNENSITGPVKS